MALTLIVEDGTKLANANSYASVADCDSYHDGHLYGDTWTNATTQRKEAALVMATRTINNNFEFAGFRGGTDQALEWPRVQVPRNGLGGGGSIGFGQSFGNFWKETELPRPLIEATCEMARELLAFNRAAEDQAKGINSLKLGQGALEIEFNPKDRKAPLTEEVMRILAPLGQPKGRGGMIRVVRVQ